MARGNLAAIDLGTNSCRLAVANADGRFLYRDAIATKLGEGLYQNMKFTPAAIERGLEALKNFSQIMENYQVERYRAIATASCRMAQNGYEFVNLVKNHTGIELEVIDGHEEARLTLLGAAQNAPDGAEYIVVYDLGGGSTEITLAQRKPALKIMHTVSIPWGARNTTEAFNLHEFDKDGYQQVRAEILKYVNRFCQDADLEHYRHKACLIATSSTPLRLVSMVKDYGSYERTKADGVQETCCHVDQIIERVLHMPLEQRIKSSYIGENRAPIFIAACIIFQAIYQGLKFDRITASLKGASEAIIRELQVNA